MPVKRRVSRHRRDQWEWEHRHALATGHDHFMKFTDYANTWNEEAAAACWADVGDELIAEAIAERPGTRPWWWWRQRGVESMCMRAEEQARYLKRRRLLTADERRALSR